MEGVCVCPRVGECDVSERCEENLCVFVLNVADKGAATEWTHTNRDNKLLPVLFTQEIFGLKG